MSLVRAPNPIWYMVDSIGQPLNDEYFAFFLTNTLPYVPQPVYKDNQGNNPWEDPLQFHVNGTLPDNLYFDPDLVYRIEIRHGNTEFDQLVYEINDFVPPASGNGPIDQGTTTTDNQISNSQFSQILFSSPLTISAAGTYQLAPNWFLTVSGTGSGTVSQDIYAADADAVTKPPYALKFNLNGWTTATLYQRFSGNGGIWASTTEQDGAITASVTALAENVDEPLQILYVPESPGVQQIIAEDTVGTGAYQVVAGAIPLPDSINSNLNNVSYVDIQIILPPTGIMHISNVQVIGQQEPVTLNYQQETIERQIDHLFHYYDNSILNLPKADLLVGWNFSLNPYQFITKTLTTVAAQTDYIADQTILHQETAGSIQSGQAAAAYRFGLQLKALTGVGGTANRVALIQYIDAASILPYWGYVLSIMARIAILTTHGTSIKLKARLIWRTSAPSLIGNTEPIASWPSGQDPVFGAGWTAINPLNDPSFTITAPSGAGNTFAQIAFDQFQLPACSSNTQYLGIVLYTTGNLNNTSTSEDSILWDKVSLVNNDFAIDPPTKTADQVLRECQFYYEKSYNAEDLPGTVVSASEEIFFCDSTQLTGANFVMATAFGIRYSVQKRSTPVLTIYSPTTGTASKVFVNALLGTVVQAGTDVDITVGWQTANAGAPSGINFISAHAGLSIYNPGGDTRPYLAGYGTYQFVADARLGAF